MKEDIYLRKNTGGKKTFFLDGFIFSPKYFSKCKLAFTRPSRPVGVIWSPIEVESFRVGYPIMTTGAYTQKNDVKKKSTMFDKSVDFHIKIKISKHLLFHTIHLFDFNAKISIPLIFNHHFFSVCQLFTVQIGGKNGVYS